ncbi:MAG: flagellar motor protein [Acidobacteria bacterium]|nr:flagellar motor protein [Acidobacteriota bacterium]
MQLDKASILGVICALGGIGLGLVLEGGSIAEMLQPSAALIVLGGTAGATLLAQPLSHVIGAVRQLGYLFLSPAKDPGPDIEQIHALAVKCWRGGIYSIERDLEGVQDPFLRQGLSMAIDNIEIQEIKEALQVQIESELNQREAEVRVFESAGGFAPTIGIIGAVLGLIQVMKHLEDMQEVGTGIAIAFVATIYGVSIANLVLLPAASKIMLLADAEANRKTMLLDGIEGIVTKKNPRVIRVKLASYCGLPPDPEAERRSPAPAVEPT